MTDCAHCKAGRASEVPVAKIITTSATCVKLPVTSVAWPPLTANGEMYKVKNNKLFVAKGSPEPPCVKNDFAGLNFLFSFSYFHLFF